MTPTYEELLTSNQALTRAVAELTTALILTNGAGNLPGMEAPKVSEATVDELFQQFVGRQGVECYQISADSWTLSFESQSTDPWASHTYRKTDTIATGHGTVRIVAIGGVAK